jgi:hypothetical protein
LRTDFRFVPRVRLFPTVFGLRALPWAAIKDFMTASTAASAAAVAAAVAAPTSICCTRAALDLAAPTIVRRVFCTKLLLTMDFLPKGASAFDYAAPSRTRIMIRLIGTPSSQRRIGMVSS